MGKPSAVVSDSEKLRPSAARIGKQEGSGSGKAICAAFDREQDGNR